MEGVGEEPGGASLNPCVFIYTSKKLLYAYVYFKNAQQILGKGQTDFSNEERGRMWEGDKRDFYVLL